MYQVGQNGLKEGEIRKQKKAFWEKGSTAKKCAHQLMSCRLIISHHHHHHLYCFANYFLFKIQMMPFNLDFFFDFDGYCTDLYDINPETVGGFNPIEDNNEIITGEFQVF